MSEAKSKTLGERRVRTTFNPAHNTYVDQLKQKSAELIDLVDKGLAAHPDWDKDTVADFGRWKSLAITAYEEAAMYAVKAATV